MKALPSYEHASFTEGENVFLQAYAATGNRAASMVFAGLATTDQDALSASSQDTARIELAAAHIIAKAETMPIGTIASALGADKMQVLARIWELGRTAEPKEAIKALFILARVHGMLGPEKASSKSVNLILQSPTPPKSATPDGLPFILDIQPQK